MNCNTIKNNNILYGMIYLEGSGNNTLTNNTVNSTSLGIALYTSNNNDIVDNTVIATYSGIRLRGSSNNILSNNTVSDVGYLEDPYKVGAISLGYSSNNNNNRLTENNVHSNGMSINIVDSSNNTLTNNIVLDNMVGILLDGSCDNLIYHNSLINNTFEGETHNAVDGSTNNSWDNGYPSGGNYWGDYTGEDCYSGPSQDILGSDGIGDNPYTNITNFDNGACAHDHYPLMQPWTGGTPQKGDLNSDNQITSADAAIALRLAATGAHDSAADVSGDNCVTSLDAFMILQAAADAIEL